MARHLSLSCDRCEKREGPRTEVFSTSVRSSDGQRMKADLCKGCWEALKREFGYQLNDSGHRKSFKVYEDPSDIQLS